MAETRSDPLELVEQAGVSDREKQEILEHIERVVTENRITASPDLFSMKSVRPGLLFPLIVDIGAVVGIALGILILALVFRQDDKVLVGQSLEYASVEGKLIQELRKESQQALVSKEQEIARVQGELQKLEQELATLVSTSEERIRQREDELRRQLLSDIETESARLTKDGVDATKLASLLATYEAERKLFYDRQLEDYRKQLENERIALERDLQTLRQSYTAQLEALRRERDQIASEYRQREDTLRKQLEQRTKVLELAKVDVTESLSAAQTELQELSKKREAAQAAENQIVGMFATVQASLTAGRNEEALQRLGELRSYLGQDSVIQIQEIARRRQMDLFLVDSLGRYIQNEARATSQTGSLAEELSTLARIRSTANDAAQARQAGNEDRALALEEQLVALLPQVAAAHDTLVNRALADGIEKENTERREGFADRLDRAVRAVSQSRYEEALELTREAFTGVPATDTSGDAVITQLVRMGYALGTAVSRQPTAGATDLAAVARRAGVDLAAEQALFRGTLDQTIRAREDVLQTRINELDTRIQTLQRERTDQVAALEQERQRQLAAQREEITTGLRAEISRRDAEIATRTERIATLEGQVNRLNTQVAGLQAEITRLGEFERIVQALTASYQTYAQSEDAALAASTSTETAMETKLMLERFLGTAEARRLFPDLIERTRRLDRAFETAFSEAALADAAEIVADLASLPNATQRRTFLTQEIQNADSDLMRELLTSLQALVP